MKRIKRLRKDIYKYEFKNLKNNPGAANFYNWKKGPYTALKARFYTEASAILVFLLLKTKIRPNTLTLIYAFCGILGGILLSIPTEITILLAIFIFFTKGILDWSDGFLAKLTNQTSLKGAVLDPYGALINSLGFQIGLGFYVANNSGFTIYYYLIAILLFFRAGRIRSFASQFIIKDI